MSNPIENLEEIEAVFILNKQDNVIISKLLTRLNGYEGLPEYTQHASLIASLKYAFQNNSWRTIISLQINGKHMHIKLKQVGEK